MANPRLSFIPDRFTLMLVGAVILASVLPATGVSANIVGHLTTGAVALLFFLHGARLSRAAILAGLAHWRLHAMVLGSTFVLFPLLGLVLRPAISLLAGSDLYVGVLYLCLLPSTVQSSIAMVSIARGKIPAAVCSASASTLMGIIVTPLLVGLLMATPGASSAINGLDAVGRIMLQLFVPFVAGHLLRPWIGDWVKDRARTLKIVDQSSILLVVYSAFGAAVTEGLWRQLSWGELGGLLLVNAILLALALCLTVWSARRCGFDKEDEITIVFCGSKKSLASGAPMANALFPASAVGTIMLPVMLFHQMQLMVCAVLAQRYPQMGTGGWFGVVAPAGTPPAVVSKLNAAIHKAMQQPDFMQKMDEAGATLIPNTPAQFQAQIEQAVARYQAVAKVAKLSAERNDDRCSVHPASTGGRCDPAGVRLAA